MAAKFKIKGMDRFMRNFNTEVRGIEKRTHAGLINAVIVLVRAAEPGTPIDVANLRSSWFTVSYKQPGNIVPSPQGETFKGPQAAIMKAQHQSVKQALQGVAKSLGSDREPILIFGYSANYAPYVHENMDAKFKRPGAHARWLYKALQRKREEMLEEIRKSARIK